MRPVVSLRVGAAFGREAPRIVTWPARTATRKREFNYFRAATDRASFTVQPAASSGVQTIMRDPILRVQDYAAAAECAKCARAGVPVLAHFAGIGDEIGGFLFA